MKNRGLIFGLEPSKYSLGRGQFFDTHSYVSGFRFIVQGFLCYFIVKNLPSIILHLSLLFNFEFSIPSPSTTRWRAIVGLMIAIGACFGGLGDMYLIYRRRKIFLRDPDTGKVENTETLEQKFPLLHDVIWGWPFLLGLSLILLAHPVDAIYGIFFGGIAYAFNHALSKRKQMGGLVKMVLNLGAGGLAIWLWSLLSITVNGFPPGWKEIQILPLF